MRLYFIRHGQSFNNLHEKSETVKRVEDPPLTEVGLQQAELLGQYMTSHSDPYPVLDPSTIEWGGGFGFTQIWASPMMRALQTALPLSTATGIAPQVWDDIFEVGGIWLEHEPDVYVGYGGMTRQQMQQDFPTYVLPDSIKDNGWWNRDRESIEQCKARAGIVAERLRSMIPYSENEVIAIVAHQAFLGLLFRHMIDVFSDGFWWMHYNTGFTRIDLTADVVLVRYMNRIDHLSNTTITT